MKAAMLFVLATALVGTSACAHGYEFKGGDSNEACATSLFDDMTCRDSDDEIMIESPSLDGGSDAVDADTTAPVDNDEIMTSTGCDA